MANTIRIYRDNAASTVYFEGSTVNPMPTNVGVATAVSGEDNRIKVVRTDKFKRGTTEFRELFKRLNYTRIRNEQGDAFATRQDAIDYLTATFAQGDPVDVNASYLGVWDAATNNPDIIALTPENGDWFYITTSGSIDPNVDGTATGSILYKVDDIVKYCSQSNFTGWQYIPNETVRVDELDSTLDSITSNSSLTQYDIHVDANYTGLEELGTAVKPYKTLETAISASSTTETTEILVNGTFTLTSALDITDNKKIHLHGTTGSTIKYANYSTVNGGLINYAGTNYSGELAIEDITFKNAGGFAIQVVSASKINIDDCTFENNGWSGTGLSLVNEETGSTLGYNSSTGSLQTFYTSQCSEGGAISVTNTGIVEITANTIKNNNKGIEVIDSGFIGDTEAFGFLSRNQIYNNVSIGVDLESSTGDALAGNRNITVYNNAINQNGDTGIKIEGGINNTLSLGVIKGNWNAGVELSHVANTRVRDLDLDNNNRAGVDAEGDQSDGFSSLQVEGDTIADGATFIAEIFNVQIHNTQLGSNTVKCGLLIRESVGDVLGSSAIIKIDNVGFIEQDYALDVECDLDNLNLIIGDCEYVDVRIQAVRFQGESGKYSELPFSNFTVDTPYADFTKDTIAKTISILDGQGGKTINVYDANTIFASNNGTDFDIILKNTDKIQLRGLTEGRVFINGAAQTGTTNDAVNALNAFFTETEGASPDPINTPVVNTDGIAVDTTTGSRTIDPVGDDEFAGNSSGYNHGFVFADQAIDQGGEHYTFQIRREGIIGMGFHKSGSTGIYSFDSLGTGTGNGNYGLHWSTWFHPTPNGPWTYYGEASGQTSLKSGWYNFDDSSTGADWLADENVLMKAGMDNNGHLYLSYFNTTTEEYVEIAKKSTPSIEGDVFNLVIKFGDSNVRLFDTPKVHLRTETDSGPTTVGDQTVYLFGTAVGTLADGIQVTDVTGNKSGFVTSASISASGQYFEFTQTGAHSTHVGLSNEDDYTSTFIQTEMNTSASVPTDRFFYGGGYIFENRDSWQPYGLTDDNGSSLGFTFNSGVGYNQQGNTHYRVGINTDGQIAFWQSTDGVNFLEAAKSLNTVPVDSTLKFLWKADDDNAELTSLTTGKLDTTPTLTYYAIESPDGVWSYPLFQTAEEANYFDANLAQPIGSGISHTHVYVDDLSGTTWYMPNSGSAMNSVLPPTGSYLSGSNWNYVATANDSNYGPPAFSQSFSLNENFLLNLQIHPLDATFTTQVTGMPGWMTYNNGYLQGTTPYVDGDIHFNPSSSYTINVNRTNAYATTNGTLDLKVLNTTPSASLPGALYNGSITSVSDFRNEGNNVTAPNAVGVIETFGNDVGSHFVYDLPNTLDDGDSYEWYGHHHTILGIVSESVDKTTDIVYDNYDAFDLFLPFWKNNSSTLTMGHSSVAWLRARGWDNNSVRAFPDTPHSNQSTIFKLSNNAGRIELYVNDNIFASSSALYGTGSDAPTFTFALPQSYTVPVNLPVFTHTANGASTPSGFTQVSGMMDTSHIMHSKSVASLDDFALVPGQRLIIPETWIESNVLPFIDSDDDSAQDNKVILGISKSNAAWGNIGINDDFWAAFNVENQGINSTKYESKAINSQMDSVNVNSDTDAFYNWGIEYGRDGSLSVMRMANNAVQDITTEPVIGGTFSRIQTHGSFFTSASYSGSIQPVIATSFGAKVRLNTSGIQRIAAPMSTNELVVTEDTFSLPKWTGPASSNVAEPPTNVTLNAGQRYKFHMGDSSIESNDILDFVLTSNTSTVYTTGVTSSGTPGTAGAFVEFNIPQDVPPISARWRSGGGAVNVPYGLSIAGSTYVAPVTGITLEGPSANQTGTNITDNGDYGWVSIGEQLSAGERFVMNNAFFEDLLAEMGDQYEIRIGLKGDNWDNGDQSTESNTVVTGEVFKGNIQLRIYKSSSNNIYLQIFHSGVGGSNQMLINTVILHNETCAFIEITNSGNNIRMGFGRNGNLGVSQGDESTVVYSDWSAYKGQTGDQGFGITSLDVMFLVTDIFNGNNDDYDGANVDWTGLSEINIPAVPTILTNWTKAIDFSGGNEYSLQVSPSSTANALRMQGLATLAPANAVSGRTSASEYARPWATAIVFKADRNSSNQHIWNSGEGAGSNDDNIYLRLDSNGQVYFGWGRQGAVNECEVAVIPHSSTGRYWGIYIAHKGTRYNGSNATASNLADAFDIRVMTNNGNDNFVTLSTNQSTSANWVTTGGRMDRSVTGTFTIGGRGSNRNFHGKVASMVVTHLKLDTAMPTDAEIKLMITDPKKWEDDYRIAQNVRQSLGISNVIYSPSNLYNGYGQTQIWLMGDGSSDSYANGIRNDVYPNDQNYTKLQLNSMVSNDIETVNINGLT